MRAPRNVCKGQTGVYTTVMQRAALKPPSNEAANPETPTHRGIVCNLHMIGGFNRFTASEKCELIRTLTEQENYVAFYIKPLLVTSNDSRAMLKHCDDTIAGFFQIKFLNDKNEKVYAHDNKILATAWPPPDPGHKNTSPPDCCDTPRTTTVGQEREELLIQLILNRHLHHVLDFGGPPRQLVGGLALAAFQSRSGSLAVLPDGSDGVNPGPTYWCVRVTSLPNPCNKHEVGKTFKVSTKTHEKHERFWQTQFRVQMNSCSNGWGLS